MTQKLPNVLPSTLRANENEARPRYYGAGAAADWHGGDVGNDTDVAEATQAVGNSHSATTETDYDPQHQEAKGLDMVPPLPVLYDLGKDYGAYNTRPYRAGTITPRMPYPATHP